jgi:hypothetical protein
MIMSSYFLSYIEQYILGMKITPPGHIQLVMSFPDIFPYGLADFGKGAKHPKAFIYCVRWFMPNADPCFHESKVFIDSLYQLMMDKRLQVAAENNVDRSSLLKALNELKGISYNDIITAAEEDTDGHPYTNPKFDSLVTAYLKSLLKTVPGSAFCRSSLREKQFGLIICFGIPLLLLSLFPSFNHFDMKDGSDVILSDIMDRSLDNASLYTSKDPFQLANTVCIMTSATLEHIIDIQNIDKFRVC